MIEIVGSEAIRADILDRLEEACQYSNGTLSAMCLLRRIVEQKAALFDFGAGLAVIDVIETESGKLVRIVAIQGSDVDKWIGEVDAVAAKLAGIVGARGIIASGRPGWKKETARHGYRMTHSTFFKEIKNA